MNTYLEEKQNDFNKALEYFNKDIASLRTGRLNPSILEGVVVEAYEVENPINAVANINVIDNSIVVAPWDKGLLKTIEKAIIEADLGLGVVNEGDKLRLTMPPLTEENRKDLVKKLNEKMEKTRVQLRQVRDSIKGSIERAFDDKEITEDDKFMYIRELDEYTADKNKELKDIKDNKEKAIMEI